MKAMHKNDVRLNQAKTAAWSINRPAMRRQAGASMLEGLGFLALGLIVIVAGAVAFQKLTGGGAVNDDIRNISSVMAAVRDLRDINGYGTGDLTASIIAANKGQPPSNMTYTSGVLYNAWNGTVAPVGTGLGWTLTSGTLPQDACVKEAMKLSQQNNVSTAINGGTATVGPVTKASAVTGCTSVTSNSIVFTFTT